MYLIFYSSPARLSGANEASLAITTSRQFKTHLESYKKKYKGKTGKREAYKLDFTSGDLFGALHLCTLYISEISQYGRKKLVCMVYDYYDFKWEWKYGGSPFKKMAIFGNNLALVSQTMGILKNFHIYITFELPR
jgi:hypothetical protein